MVHNAADSIETNSISQPAILKAVGPTMEITTKAMTQRPATANKPID
jgi:hypothetical protein